MGQNFRKNCAKCGKPGVETFECYEDGEVDDLLCPSCNDKAIDHANEQREFAYYHPSGK